MGAVLGILAFSGIVFAPALDSVRLFTVGSTILGIGTGLFAVGMLTAAMELGSNSDSGLALGAWGAVQASAAGLAVAFSGFVRDSVSTLAMRGNFGATLQTNATGYCFVYSVEIFMLFAALIALGPLVRVAGRSAISLSNKKFGLVQYPG